ncbi:hypothetical protein [Streptomyces flaveus]|uniref:hypothetical protein n=1 Tax=Streptomyces flaveus TaxID=66370 RepID=UPI00166FB90F|nr:hypothetical protein [Streptomyces flaveus]
METLINWMLTSARRIGGTPGAGLSVRTVELTPGRLRATLDLGIRRRVLAPGRNVTLYVTMQGHQVRRRDRWLPLPTIVLTTLRAFQARQSREKPAAGEAYKTSGRVVVDELGRVVKTDWLRRRVHSAGFEPATF